MSCIPPRFSASLAALLVCFPLIGCPDEGTEDTTIPAGPLVWKVVAPAIAPGAIFSLWGPSANDMWAVGGEAGNALVARYDGSVWTRDEPPAAKQQLWWVHGLAGGPVIVVGDAGAAFIKASGTWKAIPGAPEGTTLYGAWLASANDGWAVGGPFDSAPAGVTKTGDVVLRYADGAFTRVDVPALAGRTGQKRLFKVWGSGPNDVFIVGSAGLILHWDGAAWTEMESGTTALLFTVTGRSGSDVWAVGGGAKAVLLHYDGSAWTEQVLPDFSPQIIQGVWTATGRDLYLSGFFGFTARLDSAGVWDVPDPVTPQVLHGIFGDSSGRIWTGGGDIATLKPSYTGVLLTSGGETVPALDLPAPAPLDAGPTDTMTPDAGPPDAVSPDLPLPDVPARDGSGDAGPEPCRVPVTECPAEVPYAGAPCVDGLTCSYPQADELDTVHAATCADGLWGIDTTCMEVVGGSCQVPPLAEGCLGPFAGAIAGATVAVGPATAPTEAFRSFEADELIELVWGGQGSPMLAFRIQATGADEVACGMVRATVAIDGKAEVDASQPVVFRCGQTLGVFVIVPTSPIDCEDRVFTLEVGVEIPGVGSTTATVKVQGGQHCFG